MDYHCAPYRRAVVVDVDCTPTLVAWALLGYRPAVGGMIHYRWVVAVAVPMGWL